MNITFSTARLYRVVLLLHYCHAIQSSGSGDSSLFNGIFFKPDFYKKNTELVENENDNTASNHTTRQACDGCNKRIKNPATKLKTTE